MTNQELIRAANQCLIPDPENPGFNENKFMAFIGPTEYQNFLRMAEGKEELATICFLRDRFYTLEYKEDNIVLVKDDDGEVHTIMKHGKVLSTKEI